MSYFSSLKSKLAKTVAVGIFAIKWGAILHCTLEYVGSCVICSGPSMEPTIKSEEIIMAERISPYYGRVRRNDIVVSRSPINPKGLICKRVIGVAGDKIIEPTGNIIEIPKGHVWIEGDNELNSKDSRSYGPIPIGLIKGRAILRVWPFAEIGSLLSTKEYDSHF